MAEFFYGITDKGKRRERNEDTFFVKEIVNGKLIVASVIDGVGGYKGGDIAASIARSVIIKKLQHVSGNVIEALQQAVIAANEKINQQKKAGDDNERMACVLTCAVVDIANNKFWYAHVGDTRIYLLRDQSLVKISSDHSAVGFLEESGRLSEEEAMRHPRRNEINKALGFEADIATEEDFIETGESPFLPGDLLLLCSDGLTDMISSNTITSILTSNQTLAAKGAALINAANEAGGNDNITAVIVTHKVKPKKSLPVPLPKKKDSSVSSDQVQVNQTPADGKMKKSRGRVVWLFVFLIAVLGVALAVAFKKEITPKAVMPAVSAEKRDEQLEQLLLHINDSSKTFSLPDNGVVIKTKASIVINKDSFVLKGNGAVLIADSANTQPAIIVSASAKNIVLDSLVLENFDAGLLLQKNNVTLRNIRFVNCRIPVEYAVNFPDTMLSGKFKDSIFINNTLNK